jgi:uncharacterized membrane protein YqhA
VKIILEKSKYITLIAVVALLLTAFSSFIWASIKTWKAIESIIISQGTENRISAYLVEVIDAFLVALAIYVLAISIYELFIGKLDMPPGMLAHTYHELKVRLSGLVILVAAVYFLEKLIEGMPAQELLMIGGAITLVSGALVAFSYLGAHE